MVEWMVDEWTDGLMDEWMEGGWKDGWIDGWKNSIGNSLHTKVQSQMQQICPPRSIVSKKSMTCHSMNKFARNSNHSHKLRKHQSPMGIILYSNVLILTWSKSNNRCRKQSKPGNEKHSVNCLDRSLVSLLIPQPSYNRQIFSLIAKVEVVSFNPNPKAVALILS